MLDSFDKKLLIAVQEDAARSSAELAEAVGLSASPCWRRLQRLKDEGYITRQVAQLDRRKLGLSTVIFAQVRLSAHGRTHFDEFAAAVRAFPEVLEAYVLLGPVDFLLKIVTESVEAYEHFFFHKLSKLKGVQEVNSVVALSEVKVTSALPVR